jgi:hypothetical protein
MTHVDPRGLDEWLKRTPEHHKWFLWPAFFLFFVGSDPLRCQ